MSDVHVVPARGAGSLGDRLTLLRRLVADGHAVKFEVAPTDAPVAAVVTAAIEAGAADVVAVGEQPGPAGVVRAGSIDRDVRRAADVATALVVERAGVAPDVGRGR